MTSSVVGAAASLPSFVAIKSNDYSDKGHVYYKEGGPVALGEESVFSTLAKIEVEPAKSSDKYVSLRFCYTNRYWARATDSKWVVAESDQPEEDTTKPSCTLFEVTEVGDDGTYYLSHVQSGGRVVFDGETLSVYVDDANDPSEGQGYVKLVDYGALVKLPANGAFKGSNGMYLQGLSNLYFISNDPNMTLCNFGFEVMADGHVRIKELLNGGVWMSNDSIEFPDIILSVDPGVDNELTHFWPVKINESTIAIRTKVGNRFCDCYTEALMPFLRAFPTTITTEARLGLEALVLGSRLYNVRYGMDYARIFNETPFVAGSATLTNDGGEEASMGVSIEYEDSKSSTFNRSVSLTIGVTTSFTTGIPVIAEGKIEVSVEVSGTLEWGTTATETKRVTAEGSVPVPARSVAKVDYVGTRGTCDLPFSYTQEDQRSTDGGFDRLHYDDGIYTGVNYYNFDFHVRSIEALE